MGGTVRRRIAVHVGPLLRDTFHPYPTVWYLAVNRELAFLSERSRTLQRAPIEEGRLRLLVLPALVPVHEAAGLPNGLVRQWSREVVVLQVRAPEGTRWLTGEEVRRVDVDPAVLWAAERVDRFHRAVRRANAPDAPLVERVTAQADIRHILRWLWDTVCQPVVEHLERSPGWSGGRRHVRWSPTGALTRLPLHAAGAHIATDADPRPTVLDRVVSSCTPSLRVLGAAAGSTAPVSRSRLLAVALPTTPGYADLPGAAEEAAVPRSLLTRGTVLMGDQAERGRVLREIRTSDWVHFACHAVTEPHAPSTSHLVLHDGPLTITDISQLHLCGAAFAYLSACSTGEGSHRLPNEALHVGAAFHLAGFADVVASFWPLADDFAVRAAQEFYRNAVFVGRPGALALHRTPHALRDPMNPSVWASLFHLGRG